MGKIELRQYQQDALGITLQSIPTDEAILIAAATGSGKTIFFCELIRQLLTKWPNIRIGILAHRHELITQAQDKLLKVWREAPIGIACASVSSSIDLDMPCTIGSIQTLTSRLKSTAPFDLIIIDEAHRIPPMNHESQYRTFIETMREYNPAVRILGVTATPFRLGTGYIYGNNCKPGTINLFPKLHYNISISDLQKQGYLCYYHAKEIVDIGDNLKGVKVSGDYNVKQLSNEMSKIYHIGSAVKAVTDYAQDRKRIIVFAVTIEHAEVLTKAFQAEGISTTCAHSKMHDRLRNIAIQSFEAGRIRVMVNVMVLSEGFDSPAIDCVVMCRPTKSSGLHVQMAGRGLRPHPDKTDVLILDMANNFREHGDPDKPEVKYAKGNGNGGMVSVSLKPCKACKEMVPLHTKVCPACGYEFPVPEVPIDNNRKLMRDVAFQRLPEHIAVEIVDYAFETYISKNGNEMMKLSLQCRTPNSLVKIFVNEFFDFDGNASLWSQRAAQRKWRILVETEPPLTLSEAQDRAGELIMSLPDKIEVMQKDDKWWNVARWGVAPWNEVKDGTTD